MGIAFLLDLAYAAGIAISPTPVVVVILMLFSPKGRRNAIAFLVGWMIGLLALGIVIFAFLGASLEYLDAGTILSRPLVQVSIGIFLIFLGLRRWRTPAAEPKDETIPGWFTKVDDALTKSSDKFTPSRAFFLAIVMSALSPKNIALMLALFLALSQAELLQNEVLILLVVFVLISSLTIGIPILYAIVKGDGAQESLTEWKIWILANRGRAFGLLVMLLGVIVMLNGILALLQKLTLSG